MVSHPRVKTSDTVEIYIFFLFKIFNLFLFIIILDYVKAQLTKFTIVFFFFLMNHSVLNFDIIPCFIRCFGLIGLS